MTLTADSRLGSCEVIAPLGAGGMGEVCRACGTSDPCEAAVKVSHTKLPRDLVAPAARLR